MLGMSLLLLSTLPCNAEEKNGDNLLSLDLSYSLTGLLNHGWGIGLHYEKKLFNFLSVTGSFGHMTFLTGISDVYNTSVHISIFGNYYPLGNGLDKLYISIGAGCDFMNYFGTGELPDTTGDTLVHMTPQFGWKFNVLPYLMIDVSTGYKFIFLNSGNYQGIKEYVDTGFRFGLGIKLLFAEIRKEQHNAQDN